MSTEEFDKWVVAYKRRFLGPGEHWEFILEWQRQLEPLAFDDAVEVIADVAVDPRAEARFPRQHLRLIIEHANQRRESREVVNRPKHVWSPKPLPPESWDRRMLAMGLIDETEFERRRNERKEAAP